MAKILMTLLMITYFSNAWAKKVAMVLDAEGHAFAFTKKGVATRLNFGDKIDDLVDVMVEDGASLTLADYEGHHFYISGGSHLKFYNNSLELKNGNIWVQSKNNKNTHMLQTANATTRYEEGQFVMSFDNYTGKTQLLVLDGSVGFSNVLEPDLILDVMAGKFSIVDQNYSEGRPRAPMKVGLSSYKKLRSQFATLKMDASSDFSALFEDDSSKYTKTAGRAIASVAQGSQGKKGKLLFIRSYQGRAPSSVLGSPMQYYENTLRQEKKLKQIQKTGESAPIYIYGWIGPTPLMTPSSLAKMPRVPKKEVEDKGRMPASVTTMSLIHDLDQTFEQSLKQQSEQNKRHPAEVNSLIDDLESYKKNYSKDY